MTTLTRVDVRRWYTWGRTEELYDDGGTCAPISEWWADFDQWLNRVRADAWDQGWRAAHDAEQERDEAEATLRRVRELHQELWDCGNARHTNPDVGCPECAVLCCHCGDSWPCETIAILDGGDR